jgi:hypothetical protein
MKLDFILNDSEKDLAPFFSSAMISITMGYLWVLGIILVLTWPYSPLFQYLEIFRIPQAFLSTFVGSLIMVSYINLRCGLGEIIPHSGFAILERENLPTSEEERDYLFYGFPQAVLQTLWFHLLMLPFLLVGAAVTGISLPTFTLSLAVVSSASLLCRQISFFLLLLLGRWHSIGYYGSRLFYLLFLGGTAFFVPILNPVLLLYNLHYGERVPIGPILPTTVPYFIVVLSVLFLFFLASEWIIRRRTLHNRTKVDRDL